MKRCIVYFLLAILTTIIIPSCKKEKPKTKAEIELQEKEEKAKTEYNQCVEYNGIIQNIAKYYKVGLLRQFGYKEGHDTYVLGLDTCTKQIMKYFNSLRRNNIPTPPSDVPFIKALIIKYATHTVINRPKALLCQANLTACQLNLKTCQEADKLVIENTTKKTYFPITNEEVKKQSLEDFSKQLSDLEYGPSELICVCCDAKLVVRRNYYPDGKSIPVLRNLSDECSSNCRDNKIVHKTKDGCRWDYNVLAEQVPLPKSSKTKLKAKK